MCKNKDWIRWPRICSAADFLFNLVMMLPLIRRKKLLDT